MRRSSWIRLLAAAVVFAGSWLAHTQSRPLVPVKVQKVKNDLFLICSQSDDCPIMGAGGNVAVRVTPEGVILIDDKYEQDFSNIVAAVKTVTDKPIKYVINTHSHGDHTGSNKQFLNIAELISQRNARENMVKTNPQPGLPHIVFNDQMSVHLGGAEVQLYYMGPGHTNGDAIVYFPDLKVIHAGDLMNRDTPLNVDYTMGGSALEWTRTFDNVMKLDFETLIPGHGKMMSKAEFKTYRDNMETLKQRITQLVRQGVKKEDLAGKLDAKGLGWNLNLAQPDSAFVRKLAPIFDEIAAAR